MDDSGGEGRAGGSGGSEGAAGELVENGDLFAGERNAAWLGPANEEQCADEGAVAHGDERERAGRVGELAPPDGKVGRDGAVTRVVDDDDFETRETNAEDAALAGVRRGGGALARGHGPFGALRERIAQAVGRGEDGRAERGFRGVARGREGGVPRVGRGGLKRAGVKDAGRDEFAIPRRSGRGRFSGGGRGGVGGRDRERWARVRAKGRLVVDRSVGGGNERGGGEGVGFGVEGGLDFCFRGAGAGGEEVVEATAEAAEAECGQGADTVAAGKAGEALVGVEEGGLGMFGGVGHDAGKPVAEFGGFAFEGFRSIAGIESEEGEAAAEVGEADEAGVERRGGAAEALGVVVAEGAEDLVGEAAAGEELAAEVDGGEAEDGPVGIGIGDGAGAAHGFAGVLGRSGGHDDAAEVTEGGAGEGEFGVVSASAGGEAMGDKTGAEGDGGGFALFGGVGGAGGLEQHERDGDGADAVVADLVDGLRESGEGGDAGVVGEGVGDGDDAGEDNSVFLDQLGEFGDSDLGEVEGEGLDELQELRQRGAAARLQHGAGALERLLGRERGWHLG